MRDLRRGQCRARVGAAKNHGGTLGVDPFAGLRGRNVCLVLVVRRQQFDRLAQRLAAEIVDGHLDGRGAPFAFYVRVEARHVGDKSDDDFFLRVRRAGGHACSGQHQCQSGVLVFHAESPYRRLENKNERKFIGQRSSKNAWAQIPSS
ncbi:hypothetical protein D3C71_1405950 [compost metagenome]